MSLLKGTIKMGSVVNELLNLDPSFDVAGFKSTNIDGFISNFEEVQKKISQTDMKSEDFVLKFDSRVVTKMEVTKEMDDYFKDVADFKEKSNWTAFEDLNEWIGRINGSLNGIDKITEKRRTDDKAQDAVHFGSLIFNLKELLKIENSFLTPSLFLSGPSKLKPFKDMIEEMSAQTTSIKWDELQNTFDLLSDLRKATTIAEKDINLLYSVSKTRVYPHSSPRNWTIGLPNGSNDLSKLSNDMDIKSLKKMLNISYDFQRLYDGLRPIFKLPNLFSMVTLKMAKLLETDTEAMGQIGRWKEELLSIDISKEAAMKVLDLYKKTTDPVDNGVIQPVKNLLNSIDELSESLNSILELTELVKNQKKRSIIFWET
uniref:WSN domain-containing protein n=1 Tax=Caenorhabditis tropicalis TaxID=1561998 RepID=A0A1I7TQJ3_9PELO